MDDKLANISQKITIRILRGVHWLYLRQRKIHWLRAYKKIPWELSATCITLLIASHLLASWAWKTTSQMPQFTVVGEQLVVTNVPGELQRYTEKISPIGLPAYCSAFDRNLPQRVSNAYSRNPWVKEVIAVEMSYPNLISAKLILRKPLVLIKIANNYYLSDKEGVRLPGEYQEGAQPTDLFIITGVSEPLPEVGQPWRDMDLVEAIRLAYFLHKNQFSSKISGQIIHLHKRENPLYNQIVLETPHRTQIIWGRKFASALPQISAQERLQSLFTLLEQPVIRESHPQLQGIAQIDLRFGYAIVREDKRWNRRKRTSRRERIAERRLR